MLQSVFCKRLALIESEAETSDASAAADAFLAVDIGFNQCSRGSDDITRLVVYAASSAEFARIVVDIFRLRSVDGDPALTDEPVYILRMMKYLYSFKRIVFLEYLISDRAVHQQN